MGSVTPHFEEYPPQVSLARDIYRPLPILPDKLPSPEELDIYASALVSTSLRSLLDALITHDVGRVKSCFLTSQSYWRDLLSFTYHFRTFNDVGVIAPALVELSRKRGIEGAFELIPGSVQNVVVSPTLRWVEAMFKFRTLQPKAECEGRVTLLPEEGGDGEATWRIWSLSTWLEALEDYPQDLSKLQAAGRELKDVEHIDTDVFIVGGGNAGLILAAALKALNLDSLIVDKNPQPGDNWRLRYDCMRFHVPKASCETPYLSYPKDNPQILDREMLADHMKNYADTFKLNIINSSTVEASSLNQSKGVWDIKIHTPHGSKTVKARHLVQCTGTTGQRPFIPNIPGKESYKGTSVHSAEYKNPKQLIDLGAKTVAIIGSANSAFDVMEDCAKSGLQATMVARSPTYIFPWDYSLAPQGLALYEKISPELADKLQMSEATAIGGQLLKGLYSHLAQKEKDRYKKLAERGFPVYDSTDERADLMHNLLVRGGGHFNDIGDGIRMLEDGTCAVKGNVEPVRYTPTGLGLSDGSTLDADAIVWCTGFADKDPSVTAEILGGKKVDDSDVSSDVLGPHDIASLRDGVWGVDKEGEVRGLWKRHLRVNNYWTHGGTTAHHRYCTKFLAMQIKAEVEGTLPEAYRDTPDAV
ncbi:hypothetical protein VPNG_04914 [Cytospora leucostoma]|uniref:FAD/NAD(P)-binding domain-containing protein n=1 Tax=Cytospora leucostoma TaxID=1230097 RepID=A0A423X868_9PEZI|nr:hypothetical protein VPNG_04914 [Cytospora leucostoma]